MTANDLWNRWASMGLYVGGEINPLEDPEALVMDTLENLELEGRFLGMLVTWVSRYGHLLLTKKLKFKNKHTRRIFSAVVEASGHQSSKLKKMIQKASRAKSQFVYSKKRRLPVLDKIAKQDPHPAFLKQGLFLKNHELVREKILLEPKGIFKRSKILKYRALYGCSLRSDVLAVLPELEAVSIRQLAKVLNISHPALLPVIQGYIDSGFIERVQKGRSFYIKWSQDYLESVA